MIDNSIWRGCVPSTTTIYSYRFNKTGLLIDGITIPIVIATAGIVTEPIKDYMRELDRNEEISWDR